MWFTSCQLVVCGAPGAVAAGPAGAGWAKATDDVAATKARAASLFMLGSMSNRRARPEVFAEAARPTHVSAQA